MGLVDVAVSRNWLQCGLTSKEVLPRVVIFTVRDLLLLLFTLLGHLLSVGDQDLACSFRF